MEKTDETFGLQEESYEFRWTIPDWATICKDISLIRIQKFNFETRGISRVQTRWVVRFEDCGFGSPAQLCWNFVEMIGWQEKLPVKLFDGLLTSNGTFASKCQIEDIVSVGSKLKSDTRFWSVLLSEVFKNVANYIDSDGSITFVLRLTTFIPNILTKKEKFDKTCIKNLYNDLEVLLTDSSNSDLVIVTNDKKELRAHKAILTVRCAYFDAMFRSECSESASGIVKVDDVSEKTMRILLHFWYTGKLLPCWQDNDKVVEFVYAAGKYQITDILYMLNEAVGHKYSTVPYDPNCSVGLLEIVHKLSLKNAEERLLAQLIKSINNVKNGNELFIRVGIKNCEMGGPDEPSKVEALIMLNAVLNEAEDIDISYQHVRLLGLLQKLSLNVLEEKLLEKIKKATFNVKTVEEFFALFGFQQTNQCREVGLLVRALPDK